MMVINFKFSYIFFADDTLFFRNTFGQNYTKFFWVLIIELLVKLLIANLDKSSVFFSANTLEEEKKDMAETLDIEDVNDPGRYLCIPKYLGQNKHHALAFIKERLVCKI